MIIGTYIDLIKNEVRNAVFQNLASDPASSPLAGQFYFNTTTKRLRVYDGISTWVEMGSGSGGVTSVALTAPGGFAVSGSPITTSGTFAITASGTSGGILYYSSNTTTASSGLLAANSVMIGGGAGAAPTTITAGTNNQVLRGVTGGAPAFGSLVQADIPNTIPVSYWAAATANVAMGGFKITGIADATSNTDVPSWLQVQNLFQGVRDYKESVRVASTANVSVTYNATGGTSGRGQITAAPNTLNGTTLVANDRILLKDQTTGAQNGIWVVTTVGTGSNGVWDRATDFDQDSEVTSGAMVYVSSFTTTDNRGTYLLTTVDPIAIGGSSGTALTFTLINSPSGYVAGNGLTQSGFTFNVVSGNSAIVANADDITLTLATNSGLQISSGLKIQSDTTTANTIGLTLTSNGAGIIFNTNSFTDSGSETLALASTVAGNGLSITSGILAVNVDDSTIGITLDALYVKSGGITATQINSSALGTTLTGGSGTVINVANYTVVSGTTVARKYTAAITLATGSYSQTVTHNLGSQDVQVYVYETTTNTFILTEVTHTSTSVVTISGTNNTGASISARCVVVG